MLDLLDGRVPVDWPLLAVGIAIGAAVLFTAAFLGSGGPRTHSSVRARRWYAPIVTGTGTLASLVLVVRGSLVAALVVVVATTAYAVATRAPRPPRG